MASVQSHVFRQYIKWMSKQADRSGAIEPQRQAMEDAAKMMSNHKDVTVECDTINGIPAEWLTPANRNNDDVILYLHGGGYAIGSINTHRAMVSRIAAASQTTVCLIDYRLAPEHPFPAAIDDAVTVYQHLLASGYAANQIIFMGDSAGGGLCLTTMLCLRDSGMLLPKAAVLMSPFTDLTASGETVITRAKQDPMNKVEDIAITEHYVGTNDPQHPLISPLFADLGGLPPLYIQVGNDEIMLSDSTRFAKKAQAAGVVVELDVWERMWHVWQFFAPLMPEANRAIKKIGSFVQSL